MTCYRTAYHYQPPSGYCGDPLSFCWNGEYHIFPNHIECTRKDWNPWLYGGGDWGHIVSNDLVHWRQLPDALVTTPGGVDSDGCWSGSIVEDNEVFHILYTGLHKNTPISHPKEGATFTQNHATSTDMIHWVKDPRNPILSSPPKGYGENKFPGTFFHDPFVWKEADSWYMIVDTYDAAVPIDRMLLYRSNNLIDWEFLHSLFENEGKIHSPLPDFFPLDGKHVLLINGLRKEGDSYSFGYYNHWYVGQFRDHRFYPETEGELDGGYLHAVRTCYDHRKRRLLWGMVREGRPREEVLKENWAQAMSLPRVLSLSDDGQLLVEPVPELETLRVRHKHVEKFDYRPTHKIADHGVQILESIKGDCLEIVARLRPLTAQQFGLAVCCAPDMSEYTTITLDCTNGTLKTCNYSSPAGGEVVMDGVFNKAPWSPEKNDEVELHVYVDHSVIEIFVGEGRTSLTWRVYPTHPESNHLGVFAMQGEVEVTSLEVWEMRSVNSKQ